MQIFRKPGGLKSKIPPGKMVIADKGYPGEPSCRLRNSYDAPEVKTFKKRARARHETVNSRIKSFNVLAQRFCSDVSKHKVVFEAVCVITQYEMENGHPLFDV